MSQTQIELFKQTNKTSLFVCLFLISSPCHAHLLAHLVSEAFLPVTELVSLLLPHLVPPVSTVEAVMVPLLLGSVLAVALPPLGLIFPPHELVKVVVMLLSFPVFVFSSVVLVSLSASVLLSRLLLSLRLPSGGHRRDYRGSL